MQKKYRLTRNSSYNYIYRKGKSVATDSLILLYTPTKLSIKIGFAVSKKVGKAVVRNKTRRRLKELLRGMIPYMNCGFNYVFVAKPQAAELTYHDLCSSVEKALKKAGLIVDEQGFSVHIDNLFKTKD